VPPERLAELLGDALRHQQRLRRGIGTPVCMLDVLVVEIAEALAA
jgi:hypothetical protein